MALELPLFPLNVVLFPGAELPLHIFEPRYRQMINECYAQAKPFGVVLAQPESELYQEEPYTIGTMAEIEALDRLQDGRMNLIAKGTRRFRILSRHREKPYLSGIVELYTDVVEPEETLLRFARYARNLFESYLQILLEVVGKEHIDFNLPIDPEELSHFIAYFLDVQDVQKQRFLELTSTIQRLQEEVYVLRKEVPFMREILTMSNRFHADTPDRSILN
ncbi:MAG TPA: LON peptidase substrate-binding domain-containing protein [Ktedonobacteraceae bacterium]|jgi:Lon protease-like protein|nr:LON peptidase substrate-binding domain-containing protein [Ktedonobacteraceae bacterium]